MDKPPASKPRKKVPRSRRLTQRKKRAERRENNEASTTDPSRSPELPDTLPPIGVGDNDLAECICSDDEELSEFLKEFNLPAANVTEVGFVKEPDAMLTESLSDGSREVIGTELTSGHIDTPSPGPSETFTLSTLSSPIPHSLSSTSPGITGITDVSSDDEDGSLGEGQTGIFSPGSASTVSPDAGTQSLEEESASSVPCPPVELVESALSKLRSMLPSSWVPLASKEGIHLMQVSDRFPRATQKDVLMSYDGTEKIAVHLVPLSFSSKLLQSVQPSSVPFSEDSIPALCERGSNIIKRLTQYSVCVGANDERHKDIWGDIPGARVDNNYFREDHFKETCRSTSCEMLVELGKKKRCITCATLQKKIRRKGIHITPGSASSHANNRYLTQEQAMRKLVEQRQEIRAKDRKIAYLTGKLEKVLKSEGVDIDEDLSEELAAIMSKYELTPIQRIFLEEQFKHTERKDPRGHRWHPAMIRLALHLKMTSPGTFDALRDSGAVRLPSSRTLYDYSRAFDPQPGINEGILRIAADKNAKLRDHQKFATLLADEIHVSRNLVYRQSDGQLVGYVHLDEVEKEISRFENCIRGDEPVVTLHLANTILAFLVKGIISSDVNHVVAAFPCNQLTKDFLFSRCWQVISRLERVGIRVLSVVADGCAVNRAFISMHTPITMTDSGVVFDTLNYCSREERPLFFISDVAHLLKTIRNCFYNSGEGPKKTRCLEVNGEKIVWSTIVRLYVKYMQTNLRKSYKLNPQNVFPNSYSCMRVKLAAEVLSDTVASHIEQEKWPGTSQTVEFIRLCNKFFDCLNGAHSSQHIRTKNLNLKPYSDECDPRFDWLENKFLRYLEDWKKQVRALPIPVDEQDKKILSYQTLYGIEMAIRGFRAATTFLIRKAKEANQKVFIMARAFSQDPLEHYFSRQRGALGGSTNPNVSQFLGTQVNIAVQRELGIRKRKSNVENVDSMDSLNEPVPKKRRKR